MSDNIRTRIAAALKAADEAWDEVSDPHLNQADAVIRELDDMGIIHLSKVVGMEKPPLFGQHLAVGDDGPIMVNSPKEPERTWGCGKANCKACY